MPKGEKCPKVRNVAPKNVATNREIYKVSRTRVIKNIMNNDELYSVGSNRHNLILLRFTGYY